MSQPCKTFGPIKLIALGLGALALLLVPGCMGQFPGEPDIIEVKAQYLGLENRTVAVVVSTSDYIDFNFPEARQRITGEVCRLIVTNVPGVRVANPVTVLLWQDDNPYWATRPPSAILEQLEVERLVLVEIGEYRLHEPGDKYLLKGSISATVNVAEAEAADPDTYGASFKKSVSYPLRGIGRAATEEDKIELKTQAWFCEEVAGLFYDHTLVR